MHRSIRSMLAHSMLHVIQRHFVAYHLEEDRWRYSHIQHTKKKNGRKKRAPSPPPESNNKRCISSPFYHQPESLSCLLVGEDNSHSSFEVLSTKKCELVEEKLLTRRRKTKKTYLTRYLPVHFSHRGSNWTNLIALNKVSSFFPF